MLTKWHTHIALTPFALFCWGCLVFGRLLSIFSPNCGTSTDLCSRQSTAVPLIIIYKALCKFISFCLTWKIYVHGCSNTNVTGWYFFFYKIKEGREPLPMMAYPIAVWNFPRQVHLQRNLQITCWYFFHIVPQFHSKLNWNVATLVVLRHLCDNVDYTNGCSGWLEHFYLCCNS